MANTKVKLVSGEDTELKVGLKYLIISCEDDEDLTTYSNAYKYKNQLDEIWTTLFRPRHKHGYNVHKINELLGIFDDSDPQSVSIENCNALMDELEELYFNRMDELSLD